MWIIMQWRNNGGSGCNTLTQMLKIRQKLPSSINLYRKLIIFDISQVWNKNLLIFSHSLNKISFFFVSFNMNLCTVFESATFSIPITLFGKFLISHLFKTKNFLILKILQFTKSVAFIWSVLSINELDKKYFKYAFLST